ncbi:MAG TPA: alpha/beta fold hydrolase [Polyangiales bacterium]|nr:alpha/beta fold hydrolase [Polyangiales bacterium]
MSRCLAALLLVAASNAAAQQAPGNLKVEGVPAISAATLERTTPYENTRSAELLDFAARGRSVLIATRFGDVAQVHEVAGPGLDRKQLTFYREPILQAAVDPSRDDGFYFLMDSGGNEAFQIYWLDRRRGQRQLLSDGKSRNEALLVSNTGKQLAFASTRRNGKDFDIYTLSATDPTTTKLVASVSGKYAPTSWSRDDASLLLLHFVSVNESHLYTLELATGALSELNPAPGKQIAYSSPVWSQAKGRGRGVYFASDEDREFLTLTHLDLGSGRKTLLTPELNWDVSSIAVSPKGDWLAYTANEGGTDALYIASTAGAPTWKQATKIPVPLGVIGRLTFDHTGARLGFTMSTSDSTADVYVLDVATRKLSRWTESETGGLDRARFVAPTLVSYRSFDGRTIPAWFYKPKSAARAKLPVVINIHGGPESQSKAGFSAQTQYWVNELGVAVLVPNVRGSSGYGKSYLLLDNGKRREDSVADIGALLDWIGAQAELDASRVAVVGGSYGGYMVLAALTHYGERLRCGVDVVGISNFVSFLERTEAYRRDLRRAEYGDERDPEMRAFLLSIAPLTQATKIVRPLLVAQGQNDPRVPQSESEQIVATLRKQKVPVWYVLATDEGHGFQKKPNRDYLLRATSEFFEQHLLP